MPKASRGSKRAARSSPDAVSAERPRRSTRLKPTCGKTEDILGKYNTTNPKPKRTNCSRRKKQSQPLYTRSVFQANSDPNRHLPLFQLPTELLKHIASVHLPLESILSLSLTCKEALSVLGTWSCAAFKSEKRWSPARTNFFCALSRDWQSENAVSVNTGFCKRCNTLHPALKPPSKHLKVALTTYCFGQDACIDYLPRKVDIEGDNHHEDDSEQGYSLVLPHILSALKLSSSHSQKGQSTPPIPLLSGSFTTTFPNSTLHLHLHSSGRRVDGNLLVRHEYLFRKPGLCAQDILDLKLYLCPHQCSTTTGPREKSRYVRSETRNSPLFTHAINSAFPKQRQVRSIPQDTFRKPTAAEIKIMTEAAVAQSAQPPIWPCRSCSTKYRVEMVGDAQLRLIAWRCFGRDEVQARKVWRFFVRREGFLLGREKRNDEWWSPTGLGVLEFEVGE